MFHRVCKSTCANGKLLFETETSGWNEKRSTFRPHFNRINYAILRKTTKFLSISLIFYIFCFTGYPKYRLYSRLNRIRLSYLTANTASVILLSDLTSKPALGNRVFFDAQENHADKFKWKCCLFRYFICLCPILRYKCSHHIPTKKCGRFLNVL